MSDQPQKSPNPKSKSVPGRILTNSSRLDIALSPEECAAISIAFDQMSDKTIFASALGHDYRHLSLVFHWMAIAGVLQEQLDPHTRQNAIKDLDAIGLTNVFHS